MDPQQNVHLIDKSNENNNENENAIKRKHLYRIKNHIVRFEKLWSTTLFLDTCVRNGVIPTTFLKSPKSNCSSQKMRNLWKTQIMCTARQYLNLALQDKIDFLPVVRQHCMLQKESLKRVTNTEHQEDLEATLKDIHNTKAEQFQKEKDRKFSWLYQKQQNLFAIHKPCEKCEFIRHPGLIHEKAKEISKNNLTRHMNRVHDKQKTKNNLTRHMNRVHDKQKTFNCQKCPQNSSPVQKPKEHMNPVHEKQKIFNCQQCDHSSSSIQKLKEHMNHAHNKNVSKNRRFIKRSRHRLLKNIKMTQKLASKVIHNYSSFRITNQMEKLLAKGLKFTPTPKSLNVTQVLVDMFHLERKMGWKYFFHKDEEDQSIDGYADEEDPIAGNVKGSESNCNPFDKERKENMPKKYAKEISEMAESVKSDIIGRKNTKLNPNLTKKERVALNRLITLQKQGKLVIQPIDKGSGWCIMDRNDYIEEANRQLNSKTEDKSSFCYKEIKEVNVKKIHKQIKEEIDKAEKLGHITKVDAKILQPEGIKAGRLYLLPKIHKLEKFYMNVNGKRFPPCRPIISGSGSLTERISWFVDQNCKEFMKKLPSYIEDSTDLIRYFEKINQDGILPPHAIPFSLDIKSMYSNIPSDEGMEALEKVLEKREDTSIPTSFLMTLIKLVLESNAFEFNKKFYLQLFGTAMGTRMAPTYANIFMGHHEANLLENCPTHLKKLVFCFKRFIDDIFLIWLGTSDQLKEFHAHINSAHKTIKFDEPQYDETTNSCNFLDLNVSIKEGQIITDVHRKPTDNPSALLPSSSHPKHVYKNIVYILAFRLLRICSTRELFEKRLEQLKNEQLKPRKYRSSQINEVFEQIRKIDRKDAIKKKDKISVIFQKKRIHDKIKETERIIVPLTFDPRVKNHGRILHKHHTAMVTKNEHLRKVFSKAPMAALRQTPNLRNLICKAKLFDIKDIQHTSQFGWKNCHKSENKKPCRICPFTFEEASEIQSKGNNTKHKIKGNLSCKTTNGVYYWHCTNEKCKDAPYNEYIGRTKRSVQERHYNHIGYIRYNNLGEVSGKHFNQPNHHQHNMKGLLLEKVHSKNPITLKVREKFYINKFDTFDKGLNRE